MSLTLTSNLPGSIKSSGNGVASHNSSAGGVGSSQVLSRPGRIAVIGAGGLVGARLLRVLHQDDQREGVGIVRSARSLARLSDLEVRLADTSRVANLTEALSGCDTVVNAINGDVSRILEETRVVYEAALAAHCRLLVHLSSAVVYGRVPSQDIADDSPPDTRNWMLYARGKARGEIFLRRQMKLHPEFRMVVLRPGLVWGPCSHWSGMVGEELARGRVCLSNGGRSIANLVYVDNLVRMILAVHRKQGGPSGFYNVADPLRVSWMEYYRGLGGKLGYAPDQVCAWPDGRLPFQPRLAVEWGLQRKPLYCFSRWLLPRMGLGMKAKIKKLIQGGPQPPERASSGNCLPSGPPRLNREVWSLQNQFFPLPAEKFMRDYGPVALMPLEETLAATAAWLRFAGFSAAGPFDQSNLW
jgi:nucleoside-diphosphate-sugar epimerase